MRRNSGRSEASQIDNRGFGAFLGPSQIDEHDLDARSIHYLQHFAADWAYRTTFFLELVTFFVTRVCDPYTIYSTSGAGCRHTVGRLFFARGASQIGILSGPRADAVLCAQKHGD